MKPVIIYSLPRTRSSAALEACKRTNKYWEPFNSHEFFNIGVGKFLSTRPYFYYKFINSQPVEKIQDTFSKINYYDSATKILSFELFNFLPARKWWDQVQDTDSHEIFVLIRDLNEQIYSHILAHYFGYFKEQTTNITPINVDLMQIEYIRMFLDSFLRFFPKKGKLITFDTLPEEYFDKSLIKIENQNSLKNLSYIKNFSSVDIHVNNLIQYYKNEWDEKIKSLSYE